VDERIALRIGLQRGSLAEAVAFADEGPREDRFLTLAREDLVHRERRLCGLARHEPVLRDLIGQREVALRAALVEALLRIVAIDLVRLAQRAVVPAPARSLERDRSAHLARR